MRTIIKLALVVLVLAALAPGRVAAEAGIAVQSSAIENRFPEELVFRLQASAPSAIQKITLVYYQGRSKSNAYAYPQFTPGEQVQAEYRMKTGGAQGRYLPPGAQVRYYYVIEDAAGNRLQTDPQTVIYEDTRFRWETLNKGLVTVYYHDGNKEPAQRILDTAVDTMDKMGKQVGATLTEPVKIMVYKSKAEIDVALPFVSATTREQLITLGEAHAEYDLILMIGAGPGAEVTETAAHEFMHLITHQATDNPFSDIPLWLNEGLSVYAEGEMPTSVTYSRRLRAAIEANSVPPLRWMSNRPGNPDEVILFYGQSSAVVHYMVEKYGADKMRQLLAAFKEGSTQEEALKKVYGFSVDELDGDWRQSVGLAPVPVAAAPSAPAGPAKVATLVPFGSKPPVGQSSAPAAAPTAVVAAPAATPAPAAPAPVETAANPPLWLLGTAVGVLLLAAMGLGTLVWRRRG